MRLQLTVIYNTHKTSSPCVLTPPRAAARLAEANDFPESFISDSEILVVAGAVGGGELRGDRPAPAHSLIPRNPRMLFWGSVKPKTSNF